MRIPRQNRLAAAPLVAVLAGVALVTACETTSTFSPSQQMWGFVYVSALKNAAGEYRAAPTGSFFRGSITSIPDARIRTDSCFAVGDYVAPSNGALTGVTYLDAGASFSAKLGTTTTAIPRVSTSASTLYNLAAGTSLPYTPGDSVVISVPGVSGGFPATEARGRSAEPFTFDAITASTAAIPLKWTASTDGNSAMIVSLQFTPAASGSKTQEIRCAFTDDGVDSIPLRQHQAWSSATNASRTAVFTRLRTSIVPVSDGAMELISTFTVPTPTP